MHECTHAHTQIHIHKHTTGSTYNQLKDMMQTYKPKGKNTSIGRTPPNINTYAYLIKKTYHIM